MLAQYSICTKFWEKALDFVSMTAQKKLKLSVENVILNYMPTVWKLTAG